MSSDEFTKLFTYMQERFDGVDTILENMATKEDIRHLQTVIDGTPAKSTITPKKWPPCNIKLTA